MTISYPWSAQEQEAPELAKAGRELIYLFGPGQALLGTVRPDGGPRLHPICPVLDGSGLFGFIIPSPKLRDLMADGRYVLHSLPPPQNDDAFYVTGIATRVENTDRRQRVARRYLMDLNQTEEPPGFEREVFVRILDRAVFMDADNRSWRPRPDTHGLACGQPRNLRVTLTGQ